MSKRILIVDDAAFMRMMIKDILVKNGFEVVGEAQDGVEAVEKYAELKPDLVTLDITMPEKDGLTALKEILSSDSDAKVIMCSALTPKRCKPFRSKGLENKRALNFIICIF